MHIYQSDQKLWTFCHIYPDVFKYFQFFCWRQHCLISILATFLFLLHHVIFCLFTFWEEKKCIPGFNPWLFIFSKFAYFKEISRTCHISDDVIKKLMTSQGIYMHHTNPIVLKLLCAKFHVSSCSQTKVKVGGQFCPPPTQKWGSESPPGIGLNTYKPMEINIEMVLPFSCQHIHLQGWLIPSMSCSAIVTVKRTSFNSYNHSQK